MFDCLLVCFKVNLGVIFKDENLGEDMIDIVRELHGLVPVVNDAEGNEVFDRIPVVGDQKTLERGVEAQFSVRNAFTKTRRLEGLFYQLADWHHENKFLGVSILIAYSVYIHRRISILKLKLPVPLYTFGGERHLTRPQHNDPGQC